MSLSGILDALQRVWRSKSASSPWVSEFLQESGHEILVANPRKLRFIFHGDNKNDRADAEQLARVARLDPKLLSPIKHRKREGRVDLCVLRARDGLVRARTQLVV